MARNATGPINFLPTTVGLILRFYFPAFVHLLGGPCRCGTLPHQHPGHASHLGISTGPSRSVIGHSQASPENGGVRAHEHPVSLILVSRQARWVNLPHGALALIASHFNMCGRPRFASE